MAVIKLTFDGANNVAKHEAFVNAYLTNYENGIIHGLGGNLNYSISNGVVTFDSGYVSIYGRRVFIEQGTSMSILLDSSKYGYIVVTVNIANNTAELSKLELSGSYPSLTQQNLLTMDGIYQLPIFSYSKTTTALTVNSSFSRPFIYNNKTNRTNLKNEIMLELKRKAISKSGSSSNTYIFELGSITLDDALLIIPVNNYMVSFPGALIKTSSSKRSVTYGAGLISYSMSIYKNGSTLYITTGSTSHGVGTIYVYY